MDVQVTGELAEFARESTFASLPEEVRDYVTLCILDQVGVQAFGSTLPVPRLARDHVINGSTGPCTVVGAAPTASPEGAALANGISGHGFELDDVHLPSLNHPGAAVVPAALAVAELVGASGPELITAVAAGYEVMCRVGRGLSPSYVTDRGFHPQGVIGPLGAAIASASLLGLDATAFEHAMSLSVSHAGGTLQYTQSEHAQSMDDSPRLHVGLGAMGGVRSALLAKAGLRGPAEIIEGRYGLARVYADDFDLGLMTDGLGSVYSLTFNTFKARPYHALVHTAVDVTLEALSGEARRAVDHIERIVLGVPSRMGRFVGEDNLMRSVDAARHSISAMQSSLELSVAHAIHSLGGMEELLDLDQGYVVDPATLELARRVTTTADEACERDYAAGGLRGQKVKVKAEVALRDGRVLAAEGYARGSYENPLSASELRRKFDALVARTPLSKESESISTMVLGCQGLADVGDLTRLLRAR